VHNIVRVDPERRALVIADLLELGQTVRFQLRDSDAASTDLTAMAKRWRVRSDFTDVEGALLFSCNGRGQGFFTTGDHDAVVLQEGLGADEIAGYFAAGEIGPVAGRNYLHGFSAAVVAFGPG